MRNITGTDKAPAPPQHTPGCVDWCSHCALCGEAILYGARCWEHLGTYPERTAEDSGPTDSHEGEK